MTHNPGWLDDSESTPPPPPPPPPPPIDPEPPHGDPLTGHGEAQGYGQGHGDQYGQAAPSYGYASQPYPQSPYAGPPAPTYGYMPSAPYGIEPMSGLPYSEKTKTVAGLLQILLPFAGICGVGRLYTGHTTIGVLQLAGFLTGVVLAVVLIGFLIFPAVWLWTVIDGIVLLTGQPRDARGLPLRP